MAASDTVIVNDGIYGEQILASAIPSGIAGSPSTVIAANNQNAVLQPLDNAGLVTNAIAISGNTYVTIDGISINMANITNTGINIASSSNIVIRNCSVQNMPPPGDAGA